MNLWAALPVGGITADALQPRHRPRLPEAARPLCALLTLAIAQVCISSSSPNGLLLHGGCHLPEFTGGTRGFAKYGDFGFRRCLATSSWLSETITWRGVLVLATAFSIFLSHGPLGCRLPGAARQSGICRLARYQPVQVQMLVFAASAFFTGLAGGVYAGYYKVMGANTLYLQPLLFLLAMMVWGRARKTWGPLLGGAALMLADEALKDYPNTASWVWASPSSSS